MFVLLIVAASLLHPGLGFCKRADKDAIFCDASKCNENPTTPKYDPPKTDNTFFGDPSKKDSELDKHEDRSPKSNSGYRGAYKLPPIFNSLMMDEENERKAYNLLQRYLAYRRFFGDNP